MVQTGLKVLQTGIGLAGIQKSGIILLVEL